MDTKTDTQSNLHQVQPENVGPRPCALVSILRLKRVQTSYTRGHVERVLSYDDDLGSHRMSKLNCHVAKSTQTTTPTFFSLVTPRW